MILKIITSILEVTPARGSFFSYQTSPIVSDALIKHFYQNCYNRDTSIESSGKSGKGYLLLCVFQIFIVCDQFRTI
jgi:hypothetical protein